MVPALPAGCASINDAGGVMYNCSNVYYRPVLSGHIAGLSGCDLSIKATQQSKAKTAANEAAVLFEAAVLLLAGPMWWKSDGIRQFEADNGFRAERNIAIVTRKSCTCGPSASSCECANGSAFAAPGQSTDQCSGSGSAADEPCGAFPFTSRLLAIDARADRIASAMDGD
jgi:hypothetical protein